MPWWDKLALQLHDESLTHDRCCVRDPNDWLAWEPLLMDLENGNIALSEVGGEESHMVIQRLAPEENPPGDVPVFDLSASEIFPNLDYEVINQMPVSLLDSLHDYHPLNGPIRGHKETCELILEGIFAIFLEKHSKEQINALVTNRRSMVPNEIIDFIESQIGPLGRDDIRSGKPDQLEKEAPKLPYIETSEERWSSLQTYLEDSEAIGRIIHASWLGDREASRIREILQHKFTESLDQRHRLGRTVRKWPTSVNLVADRLKEGWSRPDEVRALLVVLDCCALPMGAVLLDELRRNGISINQARASLALEPTVTSISRKALAAGREPDREEDANFEPLFSTGPEVSLWRTFWRDSFGPTVITERTVNAERKLESVFNQLQTPTSAANFVVFNELDHLVHASGDVTSMAYSDMVGIAQRWMRENLIPFLGKAVDQGWRIALTSDHGCTQIRSRTNVVLGEDRTLSQAARSLDIKEMGERVIWPRDGFAETLSQELGGRLTRVSGKPCILLPSGVVSPYGSSFGFAHGGISLEEVVVPYIEIGAW